MKQKVLVTGGAGFIGSGVTDRLVAEGYSVAVVDNLSTGKRENLNPAARFYEADICDRAEMSRVFAAEKPDYINHHAAQIDVRKSLDDPWFDAWSNIIGSIILMEEARKNGAGKFIYISTGGAVYGEPEELPASEDFPVKPISAYGVSKHAVEHYLELYFYNYGLDFTALRYSNVYGPRQDPGGEAGVVAIFMEKMLAGSAPTIFGEGTQTRDYVYLGDVVDANMKALRSGSGGIFNIGTGVETSVNRVFELLARLLGFTAEPVRAEARRGEVDRISIDCSRARRELGWSAETPLEEGLAKTLAYYKGKKRG